MKKKALIFGITGQDGSYLTELLISKNYIVYGVKRRNSLIQTTRIDHIFKDKHDKSDLILKYGDVTDFSNVNNLINQIKPDEIYNLAAQSNVAISFEIPEYTAQVDAIGTLRILEAVKTLNLKKIKVYQASTSEMFGNSPDRPYNEKSRFQPVSPYGTAKLYAYWISRNYRDAYNIFVSNGILFNHESPRRGENFISRKVVQGLIYVIKGHRKCLYIGNLKSKRDWGHAKDYVYAQWLILQQNKPDDFVISTGHNFTVKELINKVLKRLEIKCKWMQDKKGLEYVIATKSNHLIKKNQIIVMQDPTYFRPNEVNNLIGDAKKARKTLNWKPEVSFDELINEMVAFDLNNIK